MARDRAPSSGRAAVLVAAGILLSRVAGVVREIAVAGFLGTKGVADAFGAALRIPKLLQNLLGEGTLSASFIPVYSQALETDEREAGRVAGAVASLLLLLTGVLVVVGIVLAEPITNVIAAGFEGERLDLTVRLMRIMLAGVGFLVLSAWCLGVLNAHRHFFLSYVAPVLWNAAIVAALVFAALRNWTDEDIATAGAWGVLAGGVAQFLVQVPAVRRVAPNLRFRPDLGSRAVRDVFARFAPAVAGRGVVTLATLVDVMLASLLATGAVAALDRAQVLYLLPISAFALSVAAAELPELSREAEQVERLRARMRLGLDRMSLFLLYTATAYVVIGPLLVGGLYERGEFTSDDTLLVWLVLAGYALGIPASGASRLLQNLCFAQGDVAGPARIAAMRALVAVVVGVVLMLQFDRIAVVDGALERVGDLPAWTPLDSEVRNAEGLPRRLGAVGLALGASVAAWLELWLLRRRMHRALGPLRLVEPAFRRLIPATMVAAVIGIVAALTLRSVPPLLGAVVALTVTGVPYLFLANWFGNRAAVELMSPAIKRLPR